MFNSLVRYSTVSSETQKDIKEYTHMWKINDFNTNHSGIGKFITTEGFINEQKLWTFDLYADGFDDSTKEYIGVNLSFAESSVTIKDSFYLFYISFLDKNIKEHPIFFLDKNMERNKLYNLEETIFIKKLVKRDYVHKQKNRLLPQGNLIITFRIYLDTDCTEANRKLLPITFSSSDQIHTSFENIFNKEKFSDVKIAVDDKIFWAYKGILANRSPVFSAMFEHEIKENNENTIEIIDIDHEVVQEMLRFIYVGKVNNIENIARNLLVAADKYEMDDLKLMCEGNLIEDLNIETVISLLILADKHEAKILKDNAMDFFKLHAKEIVQSEQFKADFNSFQSELPILEMIENLAECIINCNLFL